MQDRYAGDVGDFCKLGMLCQISHIGLRVGTNWYLTYKPEEHSNNDGKHTGYINGRSFKNCDDELLESLRIIIGDNRSVAALERVNLIPDAKYYSEILRSGNDHSFQRDVWHRNSMEAWIGYTKLSMLIKRSLFQSRSLDCPFRHKSCTARGCDKSPPRCF